MSEAAPSVTIVIAAYNAQSTIARAITSALAEPEVACVIVADDASTDGTVARARTLDDGSGRLKIMEQTHNSGPSAARNRAIEHSTSPWIGPLDADDFFMPGRIAALLIHADEADLLADDMWKASERDIDGPRTGFLETPLDAPQVIDFSSFVLSNITRPHRPRGELGFVKPLIRRKMLLDHGLRYKIHLRLGEDFELYARLLGLGARMLLIPNRGYVSVMREHSLSGQHSETDLLHLRDSDRDLQKSLSLNRMEKSVLARHRRSIDCRLQWRRLISAVKQRQPLAAILCFIRPFPVPFYLLKQLAQHVHKRARR